MYKHNQASLTLSISTFIWITSDIDFCDVWNIYLELSLIIQLFRSVFTQEKKIIFFCGLVFIIDNLFHFDLGIHQSTPRETWLAMIWWISSQNKIWKWMKGKLHVNKYLILVHCFYLEVRIINSYINDSFFAGWIYSG